MNIEREETVKKQIMDVARRKVNTILNRLDIDATVLIHPSLIEEGEADVEVKFYDPIDQEALRKEITGSSVGNITFSQDGSKATIGVFYDYDQVCSESWAHIFRSRISAEILKKFEPYRVTKLTVQETAPQYWDIEVCTAKELDEDFRELTAKKFFKERLIISKGFRIGDDLKSFLASGFEID